MPLRLAIVGRPNVGKSTLFNRLAGKRLALVDDQPGVTRDRKEAPGRIASLKLTLIDTAGYENTHDGSLESRMREQTEMAIAEAELVLFLIDARAGLTPEDEHFATLLRKANMPIVVAANKAEGQAGEAGVLDAWSLGFGEPIALSAAHGEGMLDLYEAIRAVLGEEVFQNLLNEEDEESERGTGEDVLEKLAHINIEDDTLSDDQLVEAIEAVDLEDHDAPLPIQSDKPIKLAIVGRPNAGKSTLINTLLKSDRLLTGPEAGITRDSVTIDWEWEGRRIRLVDTAGLRKRAKVHERLERMSTGETVRSLKYADVIALMMDPEDALEKQDLQIADLALREGRAIVLVVSKWDGVEDHSEIATAIRDKAARLLPNAGGAPIVFLSGLTGKHVDKLMPAVAEVHDNWSAKIKTGDLNRWLRHAIERHPPPSVHGKRIKPRYMAQMKSRPPTFVLIASRGEQMPEQYKRFLVNGIREAFDMQGTPIRLFVRQGKNPYAYKATPHSKSTTRAKGRKPK